MPRLVYRAAALRDLAEIAAYIERESGSREVAEAFIGRLTDYCEHTDESGPRSHLYVGNIIHGRRDLDAYFIEHPEEDDGCASPRQRPAGLAPGI